MSLNSIKHDKIEEDIMMIMYSKPNTLFNQFSLYNKLLDKYDYKKLKNYNTNEFKRKFMDVIRSIDQKYDDLTVIKNKEISLILDKTTNTEIFEDIENKKYEDNEFNYYEYVIDNNIDESLKKMDKFGNSIYHEMVKSDYTDLMIDLINENKFNSTIKNNDGLTPLDICENEKISKILILKKMNEMENKILKLESIVNKKTCIFNKFYNFISNISILFFVFCFIHYTFFEK
jgi:hypothetical protein